MGAIATKLAGGNASALENDAALGLMTSVENAIEMALPRHLSGERFARVALTALRTTPKLLRCSKPSILGAMIQCAQLGLEPNSPLGHAYLVPYGKECQLVLGYKGLRELAHRSKAIKVLYANEVREADHLEASYGVGARFVHVPKLRKNTEVWGYYAFAELSNGGHQWALMTKDEVETHRDRFAAAKSSKTPWATDFDEMAKKTVLKKLLKQLPISVEVADELAIAHSSDERIVRESPITPGHVEVWDVTPDPPEDDGSWLITEVVERAAQCIKRGHDAKKVHALAGDGVSFTAEALEKFDQDELSKVLEGLDALLEQPPEKATKK